MYVHAVISSPWQVQSKHEVSDPSSHKHTVRLPDCSTKLPGTAKKTALMKENQTGTVWYSLLEQRHKISNESAQTHTHMHAFWSNVCMSARPQWDVFSLSSELSCRSVSSVWCVCLMPHTVTSKQQTACIQCLISAAVRQRKRRKIETNRERYWGVCECIAAIWPCGEMRGSRLVWSKGSLAPFHSSIVRSPCLPYSPRGLRHLVLPNPAGLRSASSNITYRKDVYIFQDFGRRGGGCAERVGRKGRRSAR